MVRTRAEEKTPETTAPDVYPADSAAEQPGADHGLHVENQNCARCGREIQPTDEARKTAKGDCVHMSC